MDGLGYGLVKRGGTVYIDANYGGYTFSFEALPSDYEEKVETYMDQEYDKDENPVGDTVEKSYTYLAYKNVQVIETRIINQYNNTEKGSTNHKAFIVNCLQDYDEEGNQLTAYTVDDIEYYDNLGQLISDKVSKGGDFNKFNADGSKKGPSECLGKTIKGFIDGSAIVIK